MGYFNVLSSYVRSSGPILNTNINQADVAIKLWLMLVRKLTPVARESQCVILFGVWNKLWPSFEAIINVLELEAQNGVLSVSSQISGCWRTD